MSYNRKQRLNDNIKAIETAFILDREQRTPTARERLLLERYCGFGGLKCILNPARELADAVHWAKSDLELFAPTVELHRLIRENSKNESEYKQLMDSLKQSVLTAFYTPSAVTEALTDVLKEHQVIPEKVLEPSAGIGVFVDSVLDNNPKADIMAFEKDLLTGKMKPSIEEKQNDTVISLQKQEKPTDDAELSQKSNHQQPPVQMTLFDLWGMEEENRQAVHSTKKKAEVTVGAVAKKVSRKKASPLVKSVNPIFEVVTKPVEKEEKPSLTDAKEQETTQETKPILPGDEPYASISWEENPPINGFYEMMMTMAPEDRVLLRQKAELHRQEQLKALGVEDALDPKFKPPMEPIEVLKVQIGHGQSKGNEAKEDSKTQSTLKETNHEREQQKEQERKREEQSRKKENAMKPRPFDEKLESFHREGSMVLDSARNIGVLKDLTKYGATFMPLDLNMEQKEKAVLYIALRDAYQKLYTYEAEEQTENKQMRESLNVYYDAFFIRFGNLNAKQNVKFILMDASGRDMLSLERVENGHFTKSDIFDHPVSFSLDEVSHVDSPEEALTASLNKFGRIDLPYMTELSDMPEQELTEALKGRIYYNPLIDGYEIADRFIAAMS